MSSTIKFSSPQTGQGTRAAASTARTLPAAIHFEVVLGLVMEVFRSLPELPNSAAASG
jgi:hypothetical protein